MKTKTEKNEFNPTQKQKGNYMSGIAKEALKSFIERIERVEEEKKALAEDIKDIYAEAKSTGFDTTIMKHIIKRRRMDEHERAEFDDTVETYERALRTTPLEEYIDGKNVA